MKTDNHWLARYTEDNLADNYNLWVMGVPINPTTGLPTIIGWHGDFPPGTMNHLSNYEEKMIRLLTGTCTREEAYEFLRRGNEMFDTVSVARNNHRHYRGPSQFLSHILRHGTLVHDSQGNSQYPQGQVQIGQSMGLTRQGR